jgi:predicted permease
VTESARRVRNGIIVLALALLAALLAMKFTGLDQKLLRILAIAAGLLVTMLLITYRALLKIAEAARSNPDPPPPDDDDEDDR